jgi:translation elongation factor EF-1beta
MPDLTVDLDELATHLKNKMEQEQLSLRAAAIEAGFGAATLARLLQGSASENVPDFSSISKALSWVGRNISEFSTSGANRKSTTIADVEVQLRALPGLAQHDVEALVAMVKASYEHAKKLRTKKIA